MITTINFNTEIIMNASIPLYKRKVITRRHNIQQAKKSLAKEGAKEGQCWDFTAKIKESQNGKIFNEYIDDFVITV